MSRSLRDDLESDLAETFLNNGLFAETVTFYPAGGGASRSLAADVRSTGELVDTPLGVDTTEELLILVSNNESLRNSAGTLIGGIGTPRIGDQIVREGRPDTERFSYAGQVVKSDRVSWTLRFVRKIPYQIGGQHQPRR